MLNQLNRPLSISLALIGLVTILLGIIITLIMPQTANLSDGYRTPIIAFEFARSEGDLKFLTDEDPAGQTNRDLIDRGHKWDMAFPVAYGLFLMLLLVQFGQSGFRWGYFLAPIMILAIAFDIVENLILIEITGHLRNGHSAEHLLGRLHLATWVKWGTIGLGAGGAAVGSWHKKEYWSATIGSLTFLMTIICILTNSPPICVELMALLVFVFFAWFVIKQWLQVWHGFQLLNTETD